MMMMMTIVIDDDNDDDDDKRKIVIVIVMPGRTGQEKGGRGSSEVPLKQYFTFPLKENTASLVAAVTIAIKKNKYNR